MRDFEVLGLSLGWESIFLIALSKYQRKHLVIVHRVLGYNSLNFFVTIALGAGCQLLPLNIIRAAGDINEVLALRAA